MKKKGILRKAKKQIKRLGKEFAQTPLARAAQGRHTRGYI
jgi:hypothetical protein